MSRSLQPSRIARAGDADEVAHLLDRFQVEFGDFTPGPAVLADRVRDHVARDLSVFLLAGPGHVGVAQLRFREYLISGEPVCTVEELYVVPDRRRQGHGRNLMETAMRCARGGGATSIELTTAMTDAAARKLYEGLGFTNLEKTDDPGTQMLYYERELAP